MDKNQEFADLVFSAFQSEILKKLVFSRPKTSEIVKVSSRLCAHRGRRILAIENTLPGNTVSQKNVVEANVKDEVLQYLEEYRQANLITTMGDVEWKISSSNKTALLGSDKLKRKMSGEKANFEKAIEALDNKKNYILSGEEDFLIKLGISDSNGRVHDKRQGKFRQINKFLEYIEGVYQELPKDGDILIYDLCCGKSYLSFAVYYYLTQVKKRIVRLLGIDLKRDVINWCNNLSKSMGFVGMTFITDNVKNTPRDRAPDMVISLHACDVATDIVINRAIELSAKVVLSTPCCHRYLNDKINAEELSFVTRFPHLRNKLCEALTDSIRLARLESYGYDVSAPELTDPDDTPKNTLIRAIKNENLNKNELKLRKERYESILKFVLGEKSDSYLKDVEN